jgi:hypothetical protein
MTRVIGPTGSRRRRRFLFAPILLAACTALFWIAGAQAVHDTGTFQLDGDASSATLGTPPATDDWDKVCHQYASPLPTGGCGTTSDTTGSTAGSWTSDGALNATIFVGGGSKDPQEISNWAWKDEAGGLPDKDNILHSFAVRYSLPNDPVDVPGGTGDLGNGTACPAGTFATCDVVYFGLDRLDNSGDAQSGFWFLQATVGLGTNKVGGATGFTGLHTPGDLLVISDFSNGGGTATITIHKWDPTCTATNKPDPDCADANLRQLETSTAAKCGPSVAAGDAFCGIVNPGTITMPWSFTDKSNTPDNGALNGEFYEAGINLSTLGLAGECFSSVVSETRSSTSTTATLKDFVIGNFAVCKPTLTTEASATVASPVTPGTAVHDTATITVSGGTSPTDPTGTVTFFLCGPIASGDCSTGGTNIGTGDLSGGTPDDGIATALSPDVNCAPPGTGCSTATGVNPLAPGRYCFRAEWPGDTTYPGALSATNDTTECFAVKDTSATATAQNWLPNDSATVTTAGGTAVAGTVVFTLYDSADCTGTVLGTFTDDSAPFTTNNQTVYTAPGKMISWRAVFTPSDPNAVTGSTSHCETSTVTINNDIGS